MTQLDTLPTEQPNPRTSDLDRLGTLEILERINDEDRSVADAVKKVLPDVARAVDAAAERWRRGGRVVLFGAGTSGRLALLDAAELGPTFGVPADRYLARMAGGPTAFLNAVEGAEDDAAAGAAAASDLGPNDVAVGIAASGRTPWVIGALDAARERGAATVGIACVPRSQAALANHAEITVAVETGPEAISGSTRMKAGTAQKLVLNAFSTALMVRLGKVHGNLMVDVRAHSNEKLRRRAVRLVRAILPDVAEERASEALDAAGWEVKTAAVMLRHSVPPGEARSHLSSNKGILRAALEAAPAR